MSYSEKNRYIDFGVVESKSDEAISSKRDLGFSAPKANEANNYILL